MRTFCLLMLVAMTTGCQAITHELQPHRLWRWNYYEPTSRDAFGTFSIDDPISKPDEQSSSGRPTPPAILSTDNESVVAPMPSVKNHD